MLLSSYSTTTTTIDDAGLFIRKRVLPRPTNPGSYSTDISTNSIPSLSSICLHILANFPDQVRLAPRLYYRREITPPFSLNPRLWCTLVQVYDGLPECLRSYNIPLSDIHLPLLQRVPSTPQFSLITLLDLPACPDLTDDSISTLKLLHSLVAFDASATVLSSHAVKVLARTLVYTEYDTTRRGPWTLRILRLRNCKKIDNNVYPHLSLFPLLSVVDLRGTRCTRNPSIGFRPSSSSNYGLYHPSSLATALSLLQSISPLHSSTNAFSLHIDTLHHPPLLRRQSSTIAPQNSFVVIPSKANRSSKIITGDAETLRQHVDTKPRFERQYWKSIAATIDARLRRSDSKVSLPHSQDCFCGGKYVTRETELEGEEHHCKVTGPENLKDEFEEDSEDYPDDHEYGSDGYGYENERVSRPSPSSSSASMSGWGPATGAPRSSSTSHPRTPLPPTSVVDALGTPSPNLLSGSVTSTTRIQRPLPSHLAHQVTDHTSVSTASFYYRDVHRDNLSNGAIVSHSADIYYARACAGMDNERDKHDACLMLYRDPPAWSILDTTPSPGPSAKKVTPDNIIKHAKSMTELDQKRIRGIRKEDDKKQAALAALRKSATRRVSGHEGSGHSQSHSKLPGATQSRNPFRREMAEAKHDAMKRGPRLPSRLDITRTDPSQGAVKPLKPISAVKVPPLPTESRCQSSSRLAPTKATATTTKQMKIRTEMNPIHACDSSSSMTVAAPVTLKPPPTIIVGALKRSTSTPSMGDVAPNKKSRFSDRGNFEAPQQVKGCRVEVKQQRRSFDWTAWATHGPGK